jgi:crossover junction endodeoxyribonuclease RuvC
MINKFTVLGIDPGYDRVGWSIATTDKRGFVCVALGNIQTNNKLDIFLRYQKIQSDLKEIISYFQPTQLAIETVFFSKNKKTALRVSEARGIIIGVCLENNLEVFEYNPGAIKLAVTGDGNADKAAVEKMIRLQVKGTVTKHLDDAIDAVAIAMTHCVSK